jgi:hypothetical protein
VLAGGQHVPALKEEGSPQPHMAAKMKPRSSASLKKLQCASAQWPPNRSQESENPCQWTIKGTGTVAL